MIKPDRFLSLRSIGAIGLGLALVTMLLLPRAGEAAVGPTWAVQSPAHPSSFSSGDVGPCELEKKCDRYDLLVMNSGDTASSGPVTLVDNLPAGISAQGAFSGVGAEDQEERQWECTVGPGGSTITCNFEGPIGPGRFAPFLILNVSAPSQALENTLEETGSNLVNEVSVSGGGASSPGLTIERTPVGGSGNNFEITNFGFDPTDADGSPSAQAGGHPWALTTRLGIGSKATPTGSEFLGVGGLFRPARNAKTALVELPIGLYGNPLAAEQCTQVQLRLGACPPGSRVGVYAFAGGLFHDGEFLFTEAAESSTCCSAVYNIVPEKGYPAEFGFTFAKLPVYMYASLIHRPAGYRIRVAVPSIPTEGELMDASVMFFGTPGALNGTEAPGTFLTSPANCDAGSLAAELQMTSFGEPDQVVTKEATAYQGLTGCELLTFNPALTLEPSSASGKEGPTEADSPAGLDVDLQVPQSSSGNELATPSLKTATVTLPEGLVVNPSAADGLAGCNPSGPQGINLGSADIGPQGQDLGDPEATELGAGHAGGNGSPYDDGVYHLAAGHCPDASKLGTAVAETPLIDHPLQGQIFLGTPDCSPCADADAEAGKLLKLYLEIKDPPTGTVIKLPGTVSANASTGRLTATFKENPQLPVTDLKLHFDSGPRAALTTPPTCGTYTTSSSLEPWSAPQTPTAVSTSGFNLTSGPGGSACANTPAQQPNQPHLEAGTTSTQAGAYSPFVLKLSRADGSQRLKALDVTLPPGLTGKLAGVAECSDAQIAAAGAAAGNAEKSAPSCPLTSELGTVNVGAGSGPNPFYVQGHAYLAGPYKGAPLSMAIITPAVAGPFDLGTVVVRAALFVNESTAQITVKSDPIPQIRSGIPLDVRSIAVNISRNQFTLNPTNCNPMLLTATAFAASSNAALANPFQVAGCRGLGFKPKVALSLKGATRRTGHPALKAVVTYPKGNYANIAKAAVTLPASEFIDNARIGDVCTRPQFAAGQCPPSSVLGKARAFTPLLDKPLEGPVYFRSNGGERELPDVVADLNGQVHFVLVGAVDSVGKKGSEVSRVRNTFATVPDAPVSKFVLELKGGKKGLLVNSANLCKVPNRAVVKLDAQNGKAYDTNPAVANSCGKKSKGKKKASKRVGTSHR